MELWNKADGFNRYYYNDGLFPDDNNKGFFDEALSRGWHIGAAGGGDNHSAKWGTAVDSRIGILAPACTRRDITDALTARRFFSTLDKNIRLSFTADSGGTEMGSTVKGCSHRFRIAAIDGNGERFTEVLLYNGNHDTVASWHPSPGPVEVSRDIATNGDDYFYVKISQPDGDEAISSPIWVSCSGPVGETP